MSLRLSSCISLPLVLVQCRIVQRVMLRVSSHLRSCSGVTSAAVTTDTTTLLTSTTVHEVCADLGEGFVLTGDRDVK